MSSREAYVPGPAAGATVQKHGETWTLVMVRELRHSPAEIWRALTDPAQLKEWAPFDSDRDLGVVGPARLSAVGAPRPLVTETSVKRAEAPRALEFAWGGNDLRWDLAPCDSGTRLTLWHALNRGYVSMGAAGWHLCFDVLDRLLAGHPLGRLVGHDVMQFDGWQRLNADYASQFERGA